MSAIASEKKCPLLLLNLLCITIPDCKCQAILLLLEIVFLLALLLRSHKVCFLACLYPILQTLICLIHENLLSHAWLVDLCAWSVARTHTNTLIV